ncbi:MULTISPECIES: CbtB domain-containing protein [unclassified Crossiella]|uniref:CbtB domain-containing protein n=1 Tax=Crossiella sp. SN42 TaxID=2944808 RepID=UPI00207D6972|nr:CbtB-domain containing protein [Crossiella sp. SN42]MCO1578428.1 CbtB-domain containing protein [Crossiella sp. SN42]
MSASAASPDRPTAIPVPAWSYLVAAAALIVLYVLLQENGLVLAHASELIHEFAHDGRHALGVPCH